MKKFIVFLLVVFILVILVVFGQKYSYSWENILGFFGQKQTNTITQVTDFEGCVAAGYPVMESYPRQCNTPDGKHFTENIGNEQEMADLIKIDSPRPNTMISSPLTVTGQARGTWFFEAQFPVRLVDANNNEIAKGVAVANGDWMTENFVPFTTVLEFSATTTATGTLILKNDNPSGLPANDKQLDVPVKF